MPAHPDKDKDTQSKGPLKRIRSLLTRPPTPVSPAVQRGIDARKAPIKRGEEVRAPAIQGGADIRAGAIKRGEERRAPAVQRGADIRAAAIKRGEDAREKARKKKK